MDQKEFEQPNGLCFSPDESLLYVNDRRGLKVFGVAADGSLSKARLVRGDMGSTDGPRYGNPDGMECDALGNVWTTARGGIWVVAPTGELIGIIEMPAVAGSLVWGGEDLRTLFVCTSIDDASVADQGGPGAPSRPGRALEHAMAESQGLSASDRLCRLARGRSAEIPAVLPLIDLDLPANVQFNMARYLPRPPDPAGDLAAYAQTGSAPKRHNAYLVMV